MWKHIVLIGGGGMLPSSWSAVQPRALPESLTPTYQSPTPPCWPAIPVPPLSSYFLSVFLSLSLINVKPSNNKASILFLPAFSALHVCHCALTPPSPGPSSHRHPFTWPWSWNPGPTLPTWKVHRQHEEGAGKKSEEAAFLSLQSFLRLATGEKKDPFIIYIIYGTHRKKQAIEW